MAVNNEVLALVLGGGRGSRLFPLTQHRSKPAVPIGGKYRLIDIPISNCLHADIRRIFVLTQFNSASLNHHVTNSYRFDPFGEGFIEVLAAEYRDGPGRSLHWTITVRNRSTVVAFRDLLYITTYLDDRGGVVEERHERLKDIFQPGAVRTMEVNDGRAGPKFSSARFQIVAAEALVPVPAGE